MTETEETAKLVDTVYKHILENFNPCARQVISAGKTYLKALHGAVAASNGYLETLSKLAKGARETGSTDIGAALAQLAEVQKEIQGLQINVLQAFYVDFLVPLETNLDKDSKLVCCEQKRFNQNYRSLVDTCQKISSAVKKKNKKCKVPASNGIPDKDIRQLQELDEEKLRLNVFCKNSLKQVIVQERRRYGFVLERQCSLVKHYLHQHKKSGTLLEQNMDKWQDVLDAANKLKATEMSSQALNQQQSLPCRQHVPTIPRVTMSSSVVSDPETSSHRGTSARRSSPYRGRDDATGTDPEPAYLAGLVRARSDFNLTSSTSSLVSSEYVALRPKSQLSSEQRPFLPRPCLLDQRPAMQEQVRALYSYLSSGEHQLSFLEGDVIALIGDRKKGWQYGENLRNRRHGWFPLTYTTPMERRNLDSESVGGEYSGENVAIPPAPQRPLSTFLGSPSLRDHGDYSTWKSVELQ